jgi:hypothetical protein
MRKRNYKKGEGKTQEEAKAIAERLFDKSAAN